MRVDTALSLINNELAYPVGWEIFAEDHRKRFEESVCIHVNITDARKSEREEAPEYKAIVPGGARAKFVVPVGDVESIEDLVFRVILAILEDFTHEVREFVRVKSTNWAPFHPHKIDGIKRWSAAHGTDPFRDYLFGIA